LENKRVLAQNELELLRNKAKNCEDERNEVTFFHENAQTKIENCVFGIKENNAKIEAMKVNLNTYLKTHLI